MASCWCILRICHTLTWLFWSTAYITCGGTPGSDPSINFIRLSIGSLGTTRISSLSPQIHTHRLKVGVVCSLCVHHLQFALHHPGISTCSVVRRFSPKWVFALLSGTTQCRVWISPDSNPCTPLISCAYRTHWVFSHICFLDCFTELACCHPAVMFCIGRVDGNALLQSHWRM